VVQTPIDAWSKIVVIDFETTGLKAGYQPVSIAILELSDDLQELARYVSLLNPGIPIDRRASEIHGIVIDDVVDEPSLDTYLRVILSDRYRDQRLLVIGHNVEYDLQLFRPYCGTITELCTKKLAEALFPNLRSFSLDSVSDFLGIPATNRHSAIADAVLTHKAVIQMADRSQMSLNELVAAQFVISADTPMRFGKHRGLPIKDLPFDYVQWLVRKLEPKDHRLREALRQVHGI